MFLVTSGFAQTFSGNKHLHYNLQDGLSFGIVNSISQDSHGFMWFATSDGLNRFDGNSFKVFKNEKDNPFSLSGNYVQAILTDKNGDLWVSSRDGLNKYDPQSGHFKHYRFGSNDSGRKHDVSCIAQGRDGNLWIGTDNGFYNFNPKTEQFTFYNTQNLPGLTSNSILSIFQDNRGWLWVGTVYHGLSVFQISSGKIGKSQPFANNIPARRIHSVYQDKQGTIWIATSNGLAQYKAGQNKLTILQAKDHNLKSNIFLSIIENSKGELLVGLQDGGLYKLSIKSPASSYQFEIVKRENGDPLTNRSVQAFFEDRTGNIWLGTYGNGLYLISNANEKFRKFEVKQTEESFVRYYGMCLDAEDNLWLGTDGDGIFKTNKAGKTLKHYKADGGPGSLSDNAILSALKDSRNRLWFGTYQGGLLLYNKEKDSFRSFIHDKNNPQSLPANDVRVIYEDSKKRIWVGTNGGGLALLNEELSTFTVFNQTTSNISSDDVRSVVEDAKGNLWLGTYGGGLSYFDVAKKQFRQFFQGKDILSNNVVFALHLDKYGQLWIGTEGDGLIVYNIRTTKTRIINEKNGLDNNTINAFEAESDTLLWFSTNKGLSRINTLTGEINNYDSRDGLQQGQFHEGSALFSKKSGFMAFGGTEGWNLFYPAEAKANQTHPKVLITGLKLYGKQDENGLGEEILDIVETDKVELRPDQPVFSLNYVMLDYAHPGEGEFAYKLEGLDKEWNYVKNQVSATYRYLPPGTYTFKVKAANSDGVWSQDYSSIKVEVLPPWYKTWWAYLFYFCTAVAAVYSYIRYRTGQAKLQYEIKTAQFEAEKEKELHRKKVNFFTNISHEFRTPLTLIINPLKEMLYEEGKEATPASLNIVYRNARRLLSLVDQLLLFRKSENESEKLKIVKMNISSVSREVFLCFTQQARVQKVGLTFSTANEELEVFVDREKIEIVLFNLISNALKYTPANGNVDIAITEEEQCVVIEVKDTGPGIPDGVGEKLFEQFYQVNNPTVPVKGGFGIGLFLVRSFVEAHKGQVAYQSKIGEGTTFSIKLPKGKGHFGNEVIFEEVSEASALLEELIEEEVKPEFNHFEGVVDEKPTELFSEIKTILIIDDNTQIRQYVKQLFSNEFEVLDTDNGASGLEIIKKQMPDIVISDVMMQGLSGIELCTRVKEDPALSHIPIILLTASSSVEVKLKGIECGADDFISKPFEKEILMARVSGILRSRNNLQNYFYNQVTLQADNSKISTEYREFLDKCILVVEKHLTDPEFGIKKLADSLAMSRSTLYLRIKSVSGQSGNSFIRSIRLRKAAEIFISSNSTISETAYEVGIKDVKYFREQFNKLFGMNPSEYIRKYRSQFILNKGIKRS